MAENTNGDHDGAPAGAPRLTPGGRVVGGRYRLEESHGGFEGQSFWKAHDERLDRPVALTVVDPLPGETPPGSAAGTLDRTQALTRVYSPGLARVLDVVRGRGGGIVVSEWTPGTSLAEHRVDSESAARAARTLADAAARAEESGVVLGLDTPDRLRLAPDGHVVVAFPGVSASSDARSDVRGTGAALYHLLTGRWPLELPAGSVEHEPAHGRPESAERAEGGPVDPQRSVGVPAGVAAVAMRALDGSSVSSAATVRSLLDGEGGSRPSRAAAAGPPVSDPVDRDDTLPWTSESAPAETHETQQRHWMIMAGVGAVSVVAILALSLWLLGVAGGNNDSTPLAQQLDKIQSDAHASRSAEASRSASSSTATPTSAAVGPPLALPSATSWQPQASNGTAENSGTAGNAIDGSTSTVWQTDAYLSNFGSTPPSYKPGLGLLITLSSPSSPAQAVLTSKDAGVTVEIRSASTENPTSLSQTTLLGTATLTSGETHIDLRHADPTQYVLVWITSLHKDGPQSYRASLSEVSLLS